MPIIVPIKDLRNTTELSNLAHKEQEPIFVTKNGYSDLVVMSSELYDKFARTNRIDQAIYESEKDLLKKIYTRLRFISKSTPGDTRRMLRRQRI